MSSPVGNLIAGKTPVSPSEMRTALTQMRAGYHFVCVDTETTGKHPTARIISIALIPLVAGKMTDAWSTLVNPGLARIGAGHIHELTAEDLKPYPSFAQMADDIRTRLTPPRGKTTVLIGHNVVFDAGRLTYEYRLLDQKLPDVVLLDTLTLAQACGVNPPTAKFKDLLAQLKMSNPQEHQALSDAMYAGVAANELMNRLAAVGNTSISELLGPAQPPTRRKGDDEEAEVILDAEHQAAHDADLSKPGQVRDDSLAYCLSVNCADLPDRFASIITGPAVARHLADWAMEQVATTGPTRVQFGLLMGCLGRAIKDAGLPTKEVVTRYNKLTPALTVLGPCQQPDIDSGSTAGLDRCDRCAAGRTCRFVRVKHRFVNAFLYNDKGKVTPERAALFLPVTKPPTPRRRMDRPKAATKKAPAKKVAAPGKAARGWYATLLRAKDYDAAAYGAVLCANARLTPKDTSWALSTIKKAWDAGLRTPGVAYTYSTLIERHAGRDAAAELGRYYAVCAEVVEAGPGPDRYYWTKLSTRTARLAKAYKALTAEPKPTGKVSPNCRENQPIGPRNMRSAPPNPFAVQTG